MTIPRLRVTEEAKKDSCVGLFMNVQDRIVSACCSISLCNSALSEISMCVVVMQKQVSSLDQPTSGMLNLFQVALLVINLSSLHLLTCLKRLRRACKIEAIGEVFVVNVISYNFCSIILLLWMHYSRK